MYRKPSPSYLVIYKHFVVFENHFSLSFYIFCGAYGSFKILHSRYAITYWFQGVAEFLFIHIGIFSLKTTARFKNQEGKADKWHFHVDHKSATTNG